MFIDNVYFQSGYIAGHAGLESTASPFLFEGQPGKLWECGRTLAVLLNSEAELNAEPLKRLDKDPAEQGKTAFAKGVTHDGNPYDFGDPHGNPDEVATNAAHTGWDMGWRLAQDEANASKPAVKVYEHRDLAYFELNANQKGEVDFEKGLSISEAPIGNLTAWGLSKWREGYIKARENAKPFIADLDVNSLYAGLPPKTTGGNVNYYLANVLHPKRGGPTYVAECEDITHSLKMTPEEFCEFKAIWRTAAARLGNVKPGHKAVYDAEKRVHYANLSLTHERRAAMSGNLDEIAPI